MAQTYQLASVFQINTQTTTRPQRNDCFTSIDLIREFVYLFEEKKKEHKHEKIRLELCRVYLQQYKPVQSLAIFKDLVFSFMVWRFIIFITDFSEHPSSHIFFLFSYVRVTLDTCRRTLFLVLSFKRFLSEGRKSSFNFFGKEYLLSWAK